MPHDVFAHEQGYSYGQLRTDAGSKNRVPGGFLKHPNLDEKPKGKKKAKKKPPNAKKERL